MNQVDLSFQGIDVPPWHEAYRLFCLQLLDTMGIDGWEMSVLLCGNDVIHELNKIYRGKDEATDVLSFGQGETSPEGYVIAGDIVISLEMLDTHVGFFNVGFEEELKRLTIHGILHLKGMDHETNDSGEYMLMEQEKILETVKGAVII